MPQKNVALKGVPFDSRIANINHMSYNVKDKNMEEKKLWKIKNMK